MPPKKDDAFVTVNVRFPKALIDQIDAYLVVFQEQTPGANLTRSDVIRMGVEKLTRLPTSSDPRKSLAKAGK